MQEEEGAVKGGGRGMYDGEMLIKGERYRMKQQQEWKRGAYIERSESYLLQINSDIGTENKKTSSRLWGLYQSFML